MEGIKALGRQITLWIRRWDYGAKSKENVNQRKRDIFIPLHEINFSRTTKEKLYLVTRLSLKKIRFVEIGSPL